MVVTGALKLPLTVIAMKGHPGTGKTTLARSLASHLQIPLIDKDDVRDVTLPLQSDTNSGILNDLSYDVIFRFASTQLSLGLSVIIDSPLSSMSRFNEVARVASSYGARLVIVECKPSDVVEWRRRLEARGGSGSWHKPSTWQDMEKLLEKYGGCTEYNVGDDVAKVVVDTCSSVKIEELVSMVLSEPMPFLLDNVTK